MRLISSHMTFFKTVTEPLKAVILVVMENKDHFQKSQILRNIFLQIFSNMAGQFEGVKYLGNFFCLCTISNPKDKRIKMEAKSKHCVIVLLFPPPPLPF